MTKEKIIVGLDIGTTKICAIVGRKNELGKVDILGLGRVSSNGGVTRGVVSNIDRTVSAIIDAVNIASEKSNVNINSVNVGIAGAHINSLQARGMIIRNNSESEINQDDLDRLEQDMYKLAVKPGDKIIHVIPQDYIVDNEPSQYPIGMAGVKLEGNFHIITGQIAAAKNINKCVEKANIRVNGLTLEPLASALSVLSQEEMEAGVALVDIGGGTTDVAIFHDNVIRHTAIIPYGGNIITEDIKEGCGVTRVQAEQLKVRFGSALSSESSADEIIVIEGLKGRDPKEISAKNLAKIIEARIREIIDLVYYEIKVSNLEKKLGGGIVLTGGGALLKHLTHVVELNTGLDAKIGYPNEHLAKGMVDEVKSPAYATAVGLIMKGLENEFEIELQDEEEEVTVDGEKSAKKAPFFEKIKKWLSDGSDFADFE